MLRACWPAAGSLREVYSVNASGQLEVTATVRVSAGTEVTRQVYRRGERWTPKYKWPSGGLWGGS